MLNMKYVAFECPVKGWQFVIFPSTMKHNDAWASLVNMWPGYKLLSAGFVNDEWECYGKSTSLGVTSDPDDTMRMSRFLKEQ